MIEITNNHINILAMATAAKDLIVNIEDIDIGCSNYFLGRAVGELNALELIIVHGDSMRINISGVLKELGLIGNNRLVMRNLLREHPLELCTFDTPGLIAVGELKAAGFVDVIGDVAILHPDWIRRLFLLDDEKEEEPVAVPA